MPQRIQRKRTKGWRMPDNTVSVCRPGKWGTPFSVKAAIEAGYSEADAPAMAVHAFQEWLRGNPDFGGYRHLRDHIIMNVDSLRGKNLACFCPLDQPCHADVLLRMANED